MRNGIIVFGAALALAACGQTTEERAGTGALGGAVAGAVVGGPVGAVVGAGIGGAGGTYREEIKEEAKELAAEADQAMSRDGTDRPQAANPDRAEIRSMQTKLKAAGLYGGPIDGLMGPQTRTALAAYQQRQGLPQTAEADATTLERLNEGATR